jgi:hypothetical protein
MRLVHCVGLQRAPGAAALAFFCSYAAVMPGAAGELSGCIVVCDLRTSLAKQKVDGWASGVAVACSHMAFNPRDRCALGPMDAHHLQEAHQTLSCLVPDVVVRLQPALSFTPTGMAVSPAGTHLVLTGTDPEVRWDLCT